MMAFLYLCITTEAMGIYPSDDGGSIHLSVGWRTSECWSKDCKKHVT